MEKSNKKNLSIDLLDRKALDNIKLIVLDVDGVLVPRGTKIKQEGNATILRTKKISSKQIKMIEEINKKGYMINISSGRGLYMLQEMFREILPFVSLTFENGSATWFSGKIYQHVNSYRYLKDVFTELQKVRHKNIKGFEPKEFIITIHCVDRIKKIEKIVSKYNKLYCIWNREAYDIGIKKMQTKAVGLKALMRLFKLEKKNILVIGDNYNDKEMMDCGGISITADKKRVSGDFFVNLDDELLPVGRVMQQILNCE